MHCSLNGSILLQVSGDFCLPSAVNLHILYLNSFSSKNDSFNLQLRFAGRARPAPPNCGHWMFAGDIITALAFVLEILTSFSQHFIIVMLFWKLKNLKREKTGGQKEEMSRKKKIALTE